MIHTESNLHAKYFSESFFQVPDTRPIYMIAQLKQTIFLSDLTYCTPISTKCSILPL